MTEFEGINAFIQGVQAEVDRKSEIAVTIGILKRLYEATSIEMTKAKARTFYGYDILEILRFLVIAMENLQKEEDGE